MYASPAYQGYATRDQTAALFAQTMGLVALTAAVFAAGAYAGRHLDCRTYCAAIDLRISLVSRAFADLPACSSSQPLQASARDR